MENKDEDEKVLVEWDDLSEEDSESDKVDIVGGFDNDLRTEWDDLAEENDHENKCKVIWDEDYEEEYLGAILLQGPSDVNNEYYKAVEECLETFVDELDVPLEVNDVGKMDPRPYQISPAEIQRRAFMEKYNQVNAGVLNKILNEQIPENISGKTLDVFVTSRDITFGDYSFILGATSSDTSSVSTYRFENCRVASPELRKESFKSMVYHELGHLFGATNEHKRNDLVKNLGKHCGNKDVMRQGRNIFQWISHTKDRFETGEIYCENCKEAMKDYISEI